MLGPNHDSHFKRFFSSKEMVKILIERFIPSNISAKMDLNSLEPFPTEHIGLDNRKRFNDIVWKVRAGETNCFILIMLEFQSSPDWWMALRINEYSVLLYQDYIKASNLKSGDLMPPILPVVIYSNRSAWRAPLCLEDLIYPIGKSLVRYQPRQSFYLIDIGRLPENVITEADNLVAAIFRFERIGEKGGLINALAKLCSILPEDGSPSLHEVFISYLNSFITSDRAKKQKLNSCRTVQEVYTMLSDLAPNIETFFTNKGREEGIAIGREEGISLGRKEGISLGRKEGISLGRKEGIAEGIAIGKAETISNIVINILLKKFGLIPNKIKNQINTIANTKSDSDIISWALDANSLEEFENFLFPSDK